jgi:hypothetical protein
MSASGQKRTWYAQMLMSALPPKADIVQHGGNVRFMSSWSARWGSLLPLDLNGNAVVIGSTRKNYQVAMRGLVLTAH